MIFSPRLVKASKSAGGNLECASSPQLEVVLFHRGSRPEMESFLAGFPVQERSWGRDLPFLRLIVPADTVLNWQMNPQALELIAGADLDATCVTLQDPEVRTLGEPSNLVEKDRLQRPVFRRLTGNGISIALVDTGMKENPHLPAANVKHIDLIDGEGPPTPRHDHATNIAGLWIGTQNQAPGLVPGIELYDIRAFDSAGNATSGALLEAIDRAMENRVDLINASWGSRDPSPPINLAIQAATGAGIIVVCSAGNSGHGDGTPGSSTITWPAPLSEVITVGACNENGLLSSFSSTGDSRDKKPDCVEIGQDLMSTGSSDDGPYGAGLVIGLSGTSFSAPRIAAVVAKMGQAARVRGSKMDPSVIRTLLSNLCQAPQC